MINSDFPSITINGKRLSTNCKITVGETQKNIIGITLNNKETFVRDPLGVTFYFTQDSGLEPIHKDIREVRISYIPGWINNNQQYLETIVFGCDFTTLRGGVLDSSVYTNLKQIIVNSVNTWAVYKTNEYVGPLFTINLTEWSWLGYCNAIGGSWCNMCYNMEKLQFPFTALEWIGTNGFQQNGAWSESSNLGKLTIDPNGSRCEIAVNAFEGSKFNEVEIKQTLQPSLAPKLGSFSFANMPKLRTVKLLNTLIQPYNNGTNWFMGSTVYELDWGEGVNLPNNTFNNCSYLKEVTFPSTVTSIESIFARCDNLLTVNLSKITSNVTSIAAGAFEGCKYVQMEIPSTIATIGVNAFDSNYNSLYPYSGEDVWDFEDLDNPTEVLHWGSHIRFKDRSYGQVSLMSGFPWASKNYNLNNFALEYHDPTPGAVKDCTPRYVYDVKTPTYLDYNTGDPSVNQNINTVIHNNAELKAAATYPNANMNLTLYDMFEPIPYADGNTIRGAFENTFGANDTNITSVALKCPLTKCVNINGYAYNNFYKAFVRQESLSSVTCDPYVLNGEVPNNMFENCTSLFTYTNTTLFKVGDYAFYNTTSLNSVDLSKTWWIGIQAFYNSNITINSTSSPINDIFTQTGVGMELSIGTEAFKNCSNVTEVQIRGAVSIGTNAFENTNLSTIQFLNCSGVTIADYVFTDCYGLELIEFDCDSNTYFDLSASMFNGSTDRTKVVMRFNGLNQSDIENLSNYPWNLSDPTTQIRGDDWVDPNS